MSKKPFHFIIHMPPMNFEYVLHQINVWRGENIFYCENIPCIKGIILAKNQNG